MFAPMPYNILQEAEQGFIFSTVQRPLPISIKIRNKFFAVKFIILSDLFVCVFDITLYGAHNIESYSNETYRS